MPCENGSTDRENERLVSIPEYRRRKYTDAGYWQDLLFHELLDRTAGSAPERTAVIGPDRSITYGELRARTLSIARYLVSDLGLGSGDRIAVQLPNCLEYVETVLACSRVGVVPVLVLPRHRQTEIDHVLELTEAKAVLTHCDRYLPAADQVDLIEDVVAESPDEIKRIVVCGDPSTAPSGWIPFADLRAPEPAVPDSADPLEATDPGLMLLSGGTTGLPKAIPRTHNDYIFHWKHLAEVVGFESEWTAIPGVPIEHSFANAWVVGPSLWAGATLGLEPQLSPQALLELADRTDAEFLILVPTQLVDIFDDEALAHYDLPALEVVASGGQNVSNWLVEESIDRWDVGFCQAFGMGEGVQISTRPADDPEVQAETVGVPVAPEATQLRLVDPSTRTDTESDTGELAVRGPGLFPEYFCNEQATERSFDEDGWFYTGDLFTRRSDGNYVVRGRIEETINRAGEIIYAVSVEEELIQHPAIKNVALIGVPDERLGEYPCAVVELVDEQESLELEAVTEFLAERGIAVFKRPEQLVVLDQLPQTSVGKIDKMTIKDLIGDN